MMYILGETREGSHDVDLAMVSYIGPVYEGSVSQVKYPGSGQTPHISLEPDFRLDFVVDGVKCTAVWDNEFRAHGWRNEFSHKVRELKGVDLDGGSAKTNDVG